LPGSFPLVTLVVLDGWGCAPAGPGNAVELADTPVFDKLWSEYPHTTLEASGEAVGLPPGQMGNSEVGHLTIGSGRILFQDLMRVNQAIRDGSFSENHALVEVFERARARGGDVHLLGLVSTGGVHSHLEHLRALLELARRLGMEERTWIHAFTDGRDVSPTSASADLAELPPERIATIVGRYYAMDRDKRWDRTERALAAIVAGEGQLAADPLTAIQASYEEGVTDEFVQPVVLSGRSRLAPPDAAIFFNFRPDRARQLTEALTDPGFDGFDRGEAPGVRLTTLTEYREEWDHPVAFPPDPPAVTLAGVLAEHGVRQLHVAETEKYAHVTYFFNGGEEDPYDGEERALVDSPRDVATYDLKPEMSARAAAGAFVNGWAGRDYGFGIINFANPDMVGHTGVIEAAVSAIECVDECLGRVVEAVDVSGGACVITADHGNADHMLEPDGSPNTAHSMNPVPLVVTADVGALREGGILADVAPTVLALMGQEQPSAMTGASLIIR
jgi:2,3-bisphosphoglycerate-independent phosphoglycerate mutase